MSFKDYRWQHVLILHIFILISGFICEEKPVDLSNPSQKKLSQLENKHTFRPWDSMSQNQDPPSPIVIEPQPELNNNATDYAANEMNKTEQLVLVQHASLLEDLLLQLQLKPNDLILHQMISGYTCTVSTMEQRRLQSLLINSDRAMVHNHYNNHRLMLIQHTKSQLMMLNYTPPAVQCPHSGARILNRIPTSPVQNTDNAPFDDSGYSSSPCLTSSCDSSPQGSSKDTRYTPTMGRKNVPDTSPLSTPDSVNKQKRRHNNKPLDNQAVMILNTWYLANEKHPYPTIQCICQMARKTGLAHAQIRKWLANRRLRSSNTYKKTGRMNPLRYHTIERRRSHEQMLKQTEGEHRGEIMIKPQ